MDDNRSNILKASNQMLSKLQLLSVFFGEDIIYKIYVRTQVIHNLFEQNPELDINKLDLFHLQFTATLIELLRKIKKGNENNISLLLDEVQLNSEMISKMSTGVLTEATFNQDKQRQALKVNLSLRKLYKVLSDDSAEYPFSKNINAFSANYAPDFFYPISSTLYTDLITYDGKDVYRNGYAVIQRKLMGILCKYDFITEFFCGFRSGSQVLEAYKFAEEDRYFLYAPASNLFLFFDIRKLEGVDWSNNYSKKEVLVQELKNKNDKLLSTAGTIKASMPPEIKALLADNYKKIQDVDFLQQIINFDVEANILKTMLNTNII